MKSKHMRVWLVGISFCLPLGVAALLKERRTRPAKNDGQAIRAYFDRNGLFVPKDSDLGITSRVWYPSDKSDGRDAESVLPSKNVMVVGGLPFDRYWQMKDATAFVFHPAQAGTFLAGSVNKKDELPRAKELVRRMLDVAIPLPNGGLAWYYPDLYPLNRMIGPGVAYSALSQGELLSGFMKIYEAGLINKQILRRIFLALLFDSTHGGVNLGGKALLEMSLYFGPPEIILNGWLYALLYVVDYWLLSRDPEAKALIDQNMSFLASVLHNFDDETHQLSRYSDLSPYKARVVGEGIHELKGLSNNLSVNS